MAERIRKCITPPINAAGIFTAYAPFTLPINIVYRCDAIRTFKELIKKGINVFTTYYEPKGLSEATYQADYDLNASMVTLVSGTGEFLYIPNTYIESYPGDAGVVYNRKVLVIELGMLPTQMDVDYIFPLVEDLIHKNLGVANTASVVTAPYTGVITHDQHVTLEASRLVAIRGYTTIYEQLLATQKQLTAYQTQNDQLMAVIAAHPEITTKT